jgi:hypothetical protein
MLIGCHKLDRLELDSLAAARDPNTTPETAPKFWRQEQDADAGRRGVVKEQVKALTCSLTVTPHTLSHRDRDRDRDRDRGRERDRDMDRHRQKDKDRDRQRNDRERERYVSQ